MCLPVLISFEMFLAYDKIKRSPNIFLLKKKESNQWFGISCKI